MVALDHGGKDHFGRIDVDFRANMVEAWMAESREFSLKIVGRNLRWFERFR
jgi:hypothetical protein